MNLKDFRINFNTELVTIFPKTEINAFFFRLLNHLLDFEINDFFTNDVKELSEKELNFMNSVLNRLKNQEPIQYILGETEFYDLPFVVDKNTLIPRPETEELVDWIINEIPDSSCEFLDIGTGSGCIAISLKKNLPKITASALDFSEKALEVAKINAKNNEVSVNFICKNILETESLGNNYDLIVSNPPYVRNLEKKEMSENVLKYEPHSALFVEDKNPLIFYKKIAELAFENLNDNGFLFFEINQYLAKETVTLLENIGFKNIQLKNDMFKNQRMIKATKLVYS